MFKRELFQGNLPESARISDLKNLNCKSLFNWRAQGFPRGQAVVAKYNALDRVGCGIKFENISGVGVNGSLVPVFFTKNGKEVRSC